MTNFVMDFVSWLNLITAKYTRTPFLQIKSMFRHNMLLWFVKTFYERNLKKLQFATQRFDTPV